jgi:hypothetical protein
MARRGLGAPQRTGRGGRPKGKTDWHEFAFSAIPTRAKTDTLGYPPQCHFGGGFRPFFNQGEKQLLRGEIEDLVNKESRKDQYLAMSSPTPDIMARRGSGGHPATLGGG